MVGFPWQRLAAGPGHRIKKLLIAAGRAAKGKGPLPPQLWKAQYAARPGWSEFDQLNYREVTAVNAMEHVYEVVRIWTSGKSTPEIAKAYAQLVGQGIVGKDV